MDIILTRDGEIRKVKAAPTWYALLSFIPFVGGIAVLVLSIVKKQFRGIVLNGFLIGLVLSILTLFLTLLGGIISQNVAGIIALIIALGAMAFGIYFYVHIIINANRYSLAQYLEDGYNIENMDYLDEATKLWIEESKDKQRASFLFLKF